MITFFAQAAHTKTKKAILIFLAAAGKLRLKKTIKDRKMMQPIERSHIKIKLEFKFSKYISKCCFVLPNIAPGKALSIGTIGSVDSIGL